MSNNSMDSNSSATLIAILVTSTATAQKNMKGGSRNKAK